MGSSFSLSTCEESSHIAHLLQVYKEASSQKINLEKFEISFSQNVLTNICNEQIMLLGVKGVGSQAKYLGLPSLIGWGGPGQTKDALAILGEAFSL